MKHILLLFVCYHLSHAGTQVWTTGDERSLSLFNKYCSGSEDSGFDGNVNWICKRSQRQTPKVESFLHVVETIPQTPNRNQFIFLENPPNEYKHRISLQGQVGSHPKTNVYILPGIDTHTLAVTEDIKSNVSFSKPSVFYAKSDTSTENDPESDKYLTESYNKDNNKYSGISAEKYGIENDNKDNDEYSAISAANSFEYIKHPQPPAYIKRRRVRTVKIIREKRNNVVKTEKSQPQPIAVSEDKTIKKRQSDEGRSVTLHYRRRNPARFGFGQKQGDNEQEEYVPAASYYPSPYQNLRPVYIRPQN